MFITSAHPSSDLIFEWERVYEECYYNRKLQVKIIKLNPLIGWRKKMFWVQSLTDAIHRADLVLNLVLFLKFLHWSAIIHQKSSWWCFHWHVFQELLFESSCLGFPHDWWICVTNLLKPVRWVTTITSSSWHDKKCCLLWWKENGVADAKSGMLFTLCCHVEIIYSQTESSNVRCHQNDRPLFDCQSKHAIWTSAFCNFTQQLP